MNFSFITLDEDAHIITYEEYHPYGTTSYRVGIGASEVSAKRYRYTGKERDSETGLYYHGARYYACWLGRWCSADPAGMLDGLNLYACCHCNPIRYIDTDGRKGELPGAPSNEQKNEAINNASISLEHRHVLDLAMEHPIPEANPFGFADVASMLVGGGAKSQYVHQKKREFVHAARDAIKAAAVAYDLPPELVAGVIYNEYGGTDPIKPLVLSFRQLFQPDKADKTSIPPASLQIRRAAESLGYDSRNLTGAQRRSIVDTLSSPASAVFVAAKHLSDLRNIDFQGVHSKDLTDKQIAVIGARFNQGPDVKLDDLRNDLSYGATIVRRAAGLKRLLSDQSLAPEPAHFDVLPNLTRGQIPMYYPYGPPVNLR